MASISDALARCRRIADAANGEIMVGLSGGKDSLVVLDVLQRSKAFTRIEAFAMYLVPGLRCFEAPVNRAAKRAGVKLHYMPHPILSMTLENSVLKMHTVANPARTFNIGKVENALCARTGIRWHAYGDRASDSLTRRAYTQGCDGVNPDWLRCWPVWDWSTREVYSYLKARRIPVTPPQFGAHQSSGVSLEPASLSWMKEQHPNDYQQLLKYFPFADIQVIRYERGDYDEVPGVFAQAGASARRKERGLQST